MKIEKKLVYNHMHDIKQCNIIVYEGEEKEVFYDVKLYCNNASKWRKCRYCKKGDCDRGVVRFFDCRKNVDKLKFIYNLISTVAFMSFCYFVFRMDLAFIRRCAVVLVGFAAFDIVLTSLEKAVVSLRDRWYLRVLRKNEKERLQQEERKRELEEAKKQSEEIERISQIPNYNKVREAEAFVNSLRELSDTYDFGENDEPIAKCVDKFAEIVDYLKKDSSGYGRVAFLFEVYLPEFYQTINLYANFVKAEIENPEYQRVLTETVSKLQAFLDEQRIEAIFDKRSIEIQFNSAAKNLSKMLDSGQKNS